ncbi:MAG: Gfo/Idh/MocA family protein [Ardenticatenaceae bacterium]
MEKVKVGIIGCGNISGRYVEGCRKYDILDLVACADLDLPRAEALASQNQLAPLSMEGLLNDPEIQIVINLTPPAVHAEVTLAAIAAGKNVHSEKPLAINREDGQRILQAAEKKGVRVGCAPDTFLGGGLQTCRKLIDDGWIGQPVAATAFMMGHGMESWHPNPYFFYQPGAGPMFDMGPYYLTALIHLLGPIERITGVTRISFAERVVTSPPRFGERIPVNTPTHVTGLMNFASGPVGTIITSFDVWKANVPRIEIYGSEGTLSVPDPNTFRGPVRLLRAGDKEWYDMPLTHSDKVMRGIGVADLAYGLLYGRPHRANAQMAYHVLDLMLAFGESSDTNRHIQIESTCQRPNPLPTGLLPRQLDS